MKNEKETLGLYAQATDDCRPFFEHPFEQGDFVYGTDEKSMIRVSKCVISGCYDTHNTPSCKHLFNIQDFDEYVVNLKDLEELYASVELIPEVKVSESKTVCDECGGYGVVDWEYGTFTKEMECPYCEGEGYTYEEKQEPTGKMIKDPNQLLLLNDRSFRAEQIKKLIDTMELQSVYGITMRVNRDYLLNAVLFNFNISIDVLLMPTYKND